MIPLTGHLFMTVIFYVSASVLVLADGILAFRIRNSFHSHSVFFFISFFVQCAHSAAKN